MSSILGFFILLPTASYAGSVLGHGIRGANAVTATVVNDTERSVRVLRCGVGCADLTEKAEISSGHTVSFTGNSRSTPGWLVIAGMDGTTIGCLDIDQWSGAKDFSVLVSQSGPCPAGTPHNVSAQGQQS